MSAIDSLPLAEDSSYVLEWADLIEKTRPQETIREFCSYLRKVLQEDENAVVLDEHAQINSTVSLYREWGESYFARVYPALPVMSEDLDAWSAGIYHRRERDAWRGGCGEPPTVCAGGEEPTVRIRAFQTFFAGHVGNLEFDVTATYLGERLSHNVEQRNIGIFRDYVLAVVESKERAP